METAAQSMNLFFPFLLWHVIFWPFVIVLVTIVTGLGNLRGEDWAYDLDTGNVGISAAGKLGGNVRLA